MERVRFFIVACSLVLLVAGCGGDSDETGSAAKIGVAETTGSASGSLPRWVDSELAAAPGGFVSLTLSSSDFAVGLESPRLPHRPAERASSCRARAPPSGSARKGPRSRRGQKPSSSRSSRTRTRRALPRTTIWTRPTSTSRTSTCPTTGRYWVVVTPEGEDIQGVGSIEVSSESATPALGAKAPRSDNPTLADAPAEAITTASPPDTELLRDSIAGALDAHEPFVVVFATPKYCESRTCGPTVETVDAVRRDLISSPVRWIHIEIYEDNDPAKGTNEWVKQWNLPSEPWVFVVDEQGCHPGEVRGRGVEGRARASSALTPSLGPRPGPGRV